MAVSNSGALLNGPIIFAAAGDKVDKDMIVGMMRWEGATTAADDLKVCDYDSSVVYIETLGMANDNVVWDFTRFPGGGRRFPNGLKVTTLDHGTFKVWLA